VNETQKKLAVIPPAEDWICDDCGEEVSGLDGHNCDDRVMANAKPDADEVTAEEQLDEDVWLEADAWKSRAAEMTHAEIAADLRRIRHEAREQVLDALWSQLEGYWSQVIDKTAIKRETDALRHREGKEKT